MPVIVEDGSTGAVYRTDGSANGLTWITSPATLNDVLSSAGLTAADMHVLPTTVRLRAAWGRLPAGAPGWSATDDALPTPPPVTVALDPAALAGVKAAASDGANEGAGQAINGATIHAAGA